MASHDIDLLIVIIDLNPRPWHHLSSNTNGMESALDQLLTFSHAHSNLSHENNMVIIGAAAKRPYILYKSEVRLKEKDTKLNEGLSFDKFASLRCQLSDQLKQVFSDPDNLNVSNDESSMVAGLCQALSYVNKIKTISRLSLHTPRMLIMNAGSDSPSQYIDMMNCIFASQKQQILMDCIQISSKDSPFLQQAAYMTNGTYIKLDRIHSLLGLLLSLFIMDLKSRDLFEFPKGANVTLNTSCFCHQKTIEMGYVCSVCLSVFCSFLPVCTTCKTKFEFDVAR